MTYTAGDMALGYREGYNPAILEITDSYITRANGEVLPDRFVMGKWFATDQQDDGMYKLNGSYSFAIHVRASKLRPLN